VASAEWRSRGKCKNDQLWLCQSGHFDLERNVPPNGFTLAGLMSKGSSLVREEVSLRRLHNRLTYTDLKSWPQLDSKKCNNIQRDSNQNRNAEYPVGRRFVDFSPWWPLTTVTGILLTLTLSHGTPHGCILIRVPRETWWFHLWVGLEGSK
jgi:hypothetical protein